MSHQLENDNAVIQSTCSDDEQSVLDMINKIKTGSYSPKALNPNDRQACVEHLLAEGASIPEIAKIMQRSDKTIRRDREVIQEQNSLKHDPKMAEKLAGQLLVEAEQDIIQIRRAARSADASPAVRIDAHHRCFQITDSALNRLQSLGFLPTSTLTLNANIKHSIGEIPSFDEHRNQMTQLQQLAQTDESRKSINLLNEKLDRAELASNIVNTNNAKEVSDATEQ